MRVSGMVALAGMAVAVRFLGLGIGSVELVILLVLWAGWFIAFVLWWPILGDRRDRQRVHS